MTSIVKDLKSLRDQGVVIEFVDSNPKAYIRVDNIKCLISGG